MGTAPRENPPGPTSTKQSTYIAGGGENSTAGLTVAQGKGTQPRLGPHAPLLYPTPVRGGGWECRARTGSTALLPLCFLTEPSDLGCLRPSSEYRGGAHNAAWALEELLVNGETYPQGIEMRQNKFKGLQ